MKSLHLANLHSISTYVCGRARVSFQTQKLCFLQKLDFFYLFLQHKLLIPFHLVRNCFRINHKARREKFALFLLRGQISHSKLVQEEEKFRVVSSKSFQFPKQYAPLMMAH